MPDKDRVLLRTKDISVIILICTILGVFGTQFKKIYQWDEAAEKVAVLEARVASAERSTLIVSTQLEGISKQLEQINWQLRRMGHGRDS